LQKKYQSQHPESSAKKKKKKQNNQLEKDKGLIIQYWKPRAKNGA